MLEIYTVLILLHRLIYLFHFHRTTRGGSRINFRVLQNFTKKIENRNDVIMQKNYRFTPAPFPTLPQVTSTLELDGYGWQ